MAPVRPFIPLCLSYWNGYSPLSLNNCHLILTLFKLTCLRTIGTAPLGAIITLISSFVMSLGCFVTLPFLPLILQNKACFDMATIGSLLGAGAFIQYNGSLVGGIIARHIGLKPSLLIALTLRATSFIGLWLALAFEFHRLLGPLLMLMYSASALYQPAQKALLFCLVDEENRGFFLSLSYGLSNVGMAIGMLVGSLLLSAHFELLFILSGVISFLLLLVSGAWVREPALSSLAKTLARPPLRQLFTGTTFKKVSWPLMCSAFSFYTFSFFIYYFGTYVAAINFHQLYRQGLVMNCLLILILQPLLSGWIKSANTAYLMSGSFIILSLGFFSLSLGTVFTILLGVVLLTLSEIACFLKNILVITERLPHEPSMVFGLIDFSSGIGACLAGFIGGPLYAQYTEAYKLPLFWQLLIPQCLFVSISILIYIQVTKRSY